MKDKIIVDLKIVSLVVITILVGVIAFLSYQLYDRPGITGSATLGGCPEQTGSTGSSVSVVDVLPKGVPDIYGKEIGVSFDDISVSTPQKADQTINKLATYDTSISLTGDKLQRYINIASKISCEYCCGASSIIFTSDTGQYKAGDAACGCAHSYAMRGLAKYLLTYHENEYSDDQILEELGKWKVLFFPDMHKEKALVLQQNGIELNYINLASNEYRGIESGTSGGGMVGGC